MEEQINNEPKGPALVIINDWEGVATKLYGEGPALFINN